MTNCQICEDVRRQLHGDPSSRLDGKHGLAAATMRQAFAFEAVATIMARPEWNADTLDEINDVIHNSPIETCTTCERPFRPSMIESGICIFCDYRELDRKYAVAQAEIARLDEVIQKQDHEYANVLAALKLEVEN